MKKHTTPFLITLLAFTATGYLTACQKKGSGGTSQITGVQSRPAQPAKTTTSDAQPQLQNGDKDKAKNLPEQTDPQAVKPGGTVAVATPPAAKAATDSSECVWGDEPACDKLDDDAPAEVAPSGVIAPSGVVDKAPVAPATDEAGTPLPSPGEQTAPAPGADARFLSREYTGAAEDGYRHHLMSVMADRMKNSENKSAYYKTAEAITRVKAYLQDGVLQVTINHKESGKDKVTILGGPLTAESGAARLVVMNGSVRRGNDVDKGVFGKTAMSGVAVCADTSSGRCHVMVIRLEIGAKKIPVWVLHRTTNADISMADKKEFHGSDALRTFYGYFAKTNSAVLESVKTVIVDSFEVIHGASGMKITALMNDNQVVSARGPLLAPKESILTNVEWRRDLEIQDLYDQDARSGFKSSLQQSLKSVHLLTNDGRREFTLNYGFSGGAQTDLDVTYIRIPHTVRDVLEIRTILNEMRVRSEL
ncbi:MAG: hypothetical protein KF767_00185 [Bdellovibrionaceae bacterium]|nr:hypothetical protein [Pseudobdellovibrionaceae bacterium]